MAPSEEVWQAQARDGIVVQTRQDNGAAKYAQRLSTGALVRVVEKTASLIRYELVHGDGPQSGWIATRASGKDVLVQFSDQDLDAEPPVQIKKNPREALQEYCSNFGEHDSNGGKRVRIPCPVDPMSKSLTPEEQAQLPIDWRVTAELAQDMASCDRTPSSPSADGWVQDSEGERIQVCNHCSLPLGAIVHKQGDWCVHAECRAQLMLQELQKDTAIRMQEERDRKKKQRIEYGIGWEMKHVPRNAKAASKLVMRDITQGMVCLVLDEFSGTISVASTTSPAASINLEYLSTALQVLSSEGHEPVFSLEPVDPYDKRSMQRKVFVPEWLAGTAVGEVLFQADYHLKELSMGDSEQPVVGMKSCLDHAEHAMSEWNAREWFLVRKAEMQLSSGGVLVPMVKMGVEAREQVVCDNGLRDQPVTFPEHPLAKYADDFTHNFDLIAERKSVIHHLRECAKASVMAKYLWDSGRDVDESLLHLASDLDIPCSLEVPQLWNERVQSEVNIAEGVLTDGLVVRNINKKGHGVYGGVEFGLEKFELAELSEARAHEQRVRDARVMHVRGHAAAFIGPQPRPGSAEAAFNISSIIAGFGLAKRPDKMSEIEVRGATRPLLPAVSKGPVSHHPDLVRIGNKLLTQGTGAKPRPSAEIKSTPMVGAGLSHMPPRLQQGVDVVLQGVDLRLDQFDISDVKRVPSEASAGGWFGDAGPLDECVEMASAFFSCLDGGEKQFKDDGDCSLLRSVFNHALTDRRDEGDLFTPPESSYSHVQKLRGLVKEEEAVREARKQVFFSKEFVMGDACSIFPHSWASSCGITRGCTSTLVADGQPQGELHLRPEYQDQTMLLDNLLQTSSPIFDKSTEEGLRFRIYRMGSLEVRTTQEPAGVEIVGAVFSIRGKAAKIKDTAIGPQETVSLVMECVEKAFDIDTATNESVLNWRYFLVLETDAANKVIVERLGNGQLSWIEKMDNIEDRISLAKVLRSDTIDTGITIEELKAYVADPSDQTFSGAQAIFDGAVVPKRIAGPAAPSTPTVGDAKYVKANAVEWKATGLASFLAGRSAQASS